MLAKIQNLRLCLTKRKNYNRKFDKKSLTLVKDFIVLYAGAA